MARIAVQMSVTVALLFDQRETRELNVETPRFDLQYLSALDWLRFITLPNIYLLKYHSQQLAGQMLARCSSNRVKMHLTLSARHKTSLTMEVISVSLTPSLQNQAGTAASVVRLRLADLDDTCRGRAPECLVELHSQNNVAPDRLKHPKLRAIISHTCRRAQFTRRELELTLMPSIFTMLVATITTACVLLMLMTVTILPIRGHARLLIFRQNIARIAVTMVAVPLTMATADLLNSAFVVTTTRAQRKPRQ